MGAVSSESMIEAMESCLRARIAELRPSMRCFKRA